MLKRLSSPTLPVGRLLAALLAFGYSGAAAQVAPTPAPAQEPMPKNMAYYIDAKRTTQAEVNTLKGDDIQFMNVLKTAEQQKALGSSTADGAVLITTKANASSPEVVAFNRRFPLTPATPGQNAASAAAQAYVTQNYPVAKIELAGPAPQKPGYYQVIFLEAGKRMQLFFDGSGQPIKP